MTTSHIAHNQETVDYGLVYSTPNTASVNLSVCTLFGLSHILVTPPMTDTHALIFLSAAELAIWESTGKIAPTEYWGCTGQHRFAQCPQKNDPSTFARAMEKLNFAIAHAIKTGTTVLAPPPTCPSPSCPPLATKWVLVKGAILDICGAYGPNHYPK